MAAASGLRTAVTAAGVGMAAGTMGTWFEMSHGVICMPVITLPPLGLPQQVAAGTTVFGVAVREGLSALLFALDPDVDFGDRDKLNELVDTDALMGISFFGTISAMGSAAVSARAPRKFTRKANGVFCLALALFLQWRESQTRVAREQLDMELHPELRQQGEQGPASGSAATPAASAPTVRITGFGASMQSQPPVSVATTSARTPQESFQVSSPKEDWSRLALLGAASGSVIGFFGIGAAWMLAPIMRHTAPGSTLSSGVGSQFGEIDPALNEPFAVDTRTRRTACLAMVPPSIAAAWRHLALGHVPQIGGVALPLALGAIGGSVLAGNFLEDVQADEELKTALAGLLFAYGVWSILKPI